MPKTKTLYCEKFQCFSIFFLNFKGYLDYSLGGLKQNEQIRAAQNNFENLDF